MNYGNSPLLTDLYQLTMMQAYYDRAMEEEAVFEFFFRTLPQTRRFLVACGLDQALNYLESLHFSEDEIDFLHKDGRFNDDFLDRLKGFSFTGSISAMREGTIFFADEPILQVIAPLPEAQLVETRLINIMQYQTMIASKAARMTRIMPDKSLVDYGLRRSHGSEAGTLAARASYVAGFSGTATVLAGKEFGIPLYGTMAHSFIQSHDSEADAFYHFATSHPENCILLLDTYDTEKAVQKIVAIAPRLAEKNIRIRGVRLDSGDMIQLSKEVRTALDASGLDDVLIFASGDMDEYVLQKFRDSDAPIDGYGIGSKMTTSADHPYFNCAYKLVEYKGRGRRKLAESKTTWPGRKQVFRQTDGQTMTGDILGLEGEAIAGSKLLHNQMENGKRLTATDLTAARTFLQDQLAQLPSSIDDAGYCFAVTPSESLRSYADKVTAQMTAAE